MIATLTISPPPIPHDQDVEDTERRTRVHNLVDPVIHILITQLAQESLDLDRR